MPVTTFKFADDGDVPNHPRWPMIVYKQAIDPNAGDPAAAFEKVFAEHGWVDAWRNGIFAFTHYHSNAHEVLGIARGNAAVRFGGKTGKVLTVEAGDAVLLPAGTGHENLGSSADLLVIGAYPKGRSRDLKRSGEADKAVIRARVSAVPKPAMDPISGADGPVKTLWPA